MRKQISPFSQCIFGSLCLYLCTTSSAHAYLDAGTGSMLIQGIFGAAVAGLVIIKGYWFKIKNWCQGLVSPQSKSADFTDNQNKADEDNS